MNLVFLVFDVKVVENFLFLCLGQIGVSVFGLVFAFPHLDLVVFLLDQLDQVFVLVNEMGILGEEQFDFFF